MGEAAIGLVAAVVISNDQLVASGISGPTIEAAIVAVTATEVVTIRLEVVSEEATARLAVIAETSRKDPMTSGPRLRSHLRSQPEAIMAVVPRRAMEHEA